MPILLYTMASQQTLERGHGRGLGLVGRSARERTTDLRKKESAIRRKTTCSSGRRPCWNDDDFDVVANDEVVGRIFKAGVSVASPWMCYRRPFRLETTAAANCLIASSTKAGHATVSGYDRPNDGG